MFTNYFEKILLYFKSHFINHLQETQSDAAENLSHSIYNVESLLGKCHEEGDLIFFTIRNEHNVSVLI